MPAIHHLRRLVGAATLVGSLAAASAATAAPDLVVARSAGLSAPTGVAQTPDGEYWIADALMGVCRVNPGRTGVLENVYCSDEHVSAHVGPAKATGLVFDPESSSFYSGDEQSNQGAIWRLGWNRETGAIDGAWKILALADDRVTAVTSAPTADGAPARLLYATKDSSAVMRIDDPAAASPAAARAGFADRAGTTGLAVLDGEVYVTSGSDLRRFSLDGGAGRAATPVPGTAGLATTALAADRARHRIYAGTTFPELTDDLVAIDPASGAVETYERGFAGITGLGVDRDGGVLVADDPGAAAAGIDSMHQGRLWRVPLAPLGRSRVSIVAAPATWGAVASVAFGYASGVGAAFECRLDGSEWIACPGSGTGAVAYDALPPGVHVFEVRAITDLGPGVPARRVFVIDQTAPAVTVTAPAEDAIVLRGAGWIEMTADELNVAYECAIDGGPAAPCEPGEALPALAIGGHTLQVAAEDPAGNRGAAAPVRFTVADPPPPDPEPTAEPAPERTAQPTPAPRPPLVPEAPAAALPGAPDGAVKGAIVTSPARRPGARLVRDTILRPTGRAIVRIDLGAPASTTSARIRISPHGPRGAHPFVRRTVQVASDARNRLALRLSHAESRRLRPGRYRVTVALTGRTEVLKLTVVSRRSSSGGFAAGR